MFPINILDLFEFFMMSDKIDKSMIWHQRYGHLYFSVMKFLHTKNMVQGLPSISFADQVCERCTFGKKQSFLFPIGLA